MQVHNPAGPARRRRAESAKQVEVVLNRVLIRIALIGAGLALLWFATLRQSGVSCEACTGLGGQTVCRTVHGESHDTAAQTALANLCNEREHELTARLACQRAPSTRVRCSDDREETR